MRFKDFYGIARVKAKAALIKIFMPWRIVGIKGKGWRHNLLFLFTNAASPAIASRSLAVGVFTGIMPIYGFQLALLTAMTPMLRLHWPLAFLGVNVSCAPLLPFVVAAGIWVGKIIVPLLPFSVPRFFCTHALAKGGVEWFVGSLAIAIVAGISVWGLSYPIFKRLARKK